MTSNTATAAKTTAGSGLYYPVMSLLAIIAFAVPLHLGYQVTAAAEGIYGFLSGVAAAAIIRQYLTSDQLNFDHVLIVGLCACFCITLVMTYPQDPTTLAWTVAAAIGGFIAGLLLRALGIHAPPTQTL